MRKYGRTDATQTRMVRFLRTLGARVKITSSVGDGFPDAVVLYAGTLALVEIKTDGPPSRRKLTPDEQKFHDEWQDAPLYVVASDEDAVAMLNDMRDRADGMVVTENDMLDILGVN